MAVVAARSARAGTTSSRAHAGGDALISAQKSGTRAQQAGESTGAQAVEQSSYPRPPTRGARASLTSSDMVWRGGESWERPQKKPGSPTPARRVSTRCLLSSKPLCPRPPSLPRAWASKEDFTRPSRPASDSHEPAPNGKRYGARSACAGQPHQIVLRPTGLTLELHRRVCCCLFCAARHSAAQRAFKGWSRSAGAVACVRLSSREKARWSTKMLVTRWGSKMLFKCFPRRCSTRC